MKIIGAGLPRTATLTLKVALEMLGVAPCYHMVDLATDQSRVPLWADALRGSADWGKIFEGFEATVDYPGALFYKEIMAAFPDAKVVLTVRDGQSWARSIHDTSWSVYYGDTLAYHLVRAQAAIDPSFLQFTDLVRALFSASGLFAADPADWDPALSVAAMERHNAEVRRFVPDDRLLVWSPADGWAPLCEFAGAPVPDVPVPRTNDAKAFHGIIIDSCMAALNAWHAGQGLVAAGHSAGEPGA